PTIDSLSSCAGLSSAPVKSRRPVKLSVPQKSASPNDMTKAPSPTTETASQIRRRLSSVRGTQLLVVEIQGLESLLSSTPKNSPDRPTLIRRLADSYVELESSAFRTKTESRMKASQVGKGDPERPKLLSEAHQAQK